MATIQRNYSASDADMLTAAATIVDNAIEKKEFLVTKRPSWADPFFPDLKARIEAAITQILGASSVAELRRTTQRVNVLRNTASANLAELKVQLREDFRDDSVLSDRIFTELGLMSGNKFVKFADYDQQRFAQLLQQVKTGLTPELRAQIEGKGVHAGLLDDIVQNADDFFALNTGQEVQKGASKSLTDASITELNAIYTAISGVAKIARTFLRGEPKTERDKFSFKGIVRRQGTSPSASETPAVLPGA